MGGGLKARSIAFGVVLALTLGAAGGPVHGAAGAGRSRIVYTGEGGITTIDAAGGASTVLGQPPGAPLEGPFNPRWSPDGSWIAFMHQFSIWVMRADGTGRRQLTWVRSNLPSWSADGRTVYYTEFDHGLDTRIGSVNLDGSDGPAFGRPTGGKESEAVWSPDGSRVAFASRVGDGKIRIYVMSASGAGLRAITDGATDDSPQAWSPDGRKLLVSSLGPQGLAVEVMDANGGNRRVLATDAVPQAWAPNGERILFYHSATGRLKVMRTDGTIVEGALAGLGGTADWGPGTVDPEPASRQPPSPAPSATAAPGSPSAPTGSPAVPRTSTTRPARTAPGAPVDASPPDTVPPGETTPSTAEQASGTAPVAGEDPSAVATGSSLARAPVAERIAHRGTATAMAVVVLGVVLAVHAGLRVRRARA